MRFIILSPAGHGTAPNVTFKKVTGYVSVNVFKIENVVRNQIRELIMQITALESHPEVKYEAACNEN